jgi:hypothetical protein
MRFEPKFQELIPAWDAFALGQYSKDIHQINEKIKNLQEQSAEITKRTLEIVKDCKEPLYKLWYYVDSDINNNGGINTIVQENDLIKLFEYYSEGGLYIVDLQDIRANAMGYTPKFPECVTENYLKMIMNKDWNDWHKRLLSK